METSVEYLIVPPDGKFENTPAQAKMIRACFSDEDGIDKLNIKFREIYSVETAKALNRKSHNTAIGDGAFVHVT